MLPKTSKARRHMVMVTGRVTEIRGNRDDLEDIKRSLCIELGRINIS
jgi:hypothetical protein